MMLYFLNTSLTLVALVVFPVLLALVYLVQKRQKQGSFLLQLPVTPTLLLSDVSSALTDWTYTVSLQQCGQQQTCHRAPPELQHLGRCPSRLSTLQNPRPCHHGLVALKLLCTTFP